MSVSYYSELDYHKLLEVPKQDCTQSCLRSEFPKWEFGMVG